MTEQVLGAISFDLDSSKAEQKAVRLKSKLKQVKEEADQVKESLEPVEDLLASLDKQMKSLSFVSDLSKQAKEISDLTKDLQRLNKETSKVSSPKTSLSLDTKGAKSYNKEMASLAISMEKLSVAMEKNAEAFNKIANVQGQVVAANQQIAASSEQSANATTKNAEASANLAPLAVTVTSVLIKQNAELLTYATLTNKAVISTLKFANVTGVLTAALQSLNLVLIGTYLGFNKLQSLFWKALAGMVAMGAKALLFAKNIDYSQITISNFVGLLKTTGKEAINFIRNFDLKQFSANFINAVKNLPETLQNLSSALKSNVKSSFDSAQISAKGFGNEVKAASDKSLVAEINFKKLAVAAGLVLAAVIGFKALVSSFDAIVEAGREFTTQMGAVAAVRGLDINTVQGQAELAALTDKARELGATTSKSAKEAGEAMEYLALAGFDTNQILEATPALLNLSSASAVDLGRSADIASDLMSAFGKSTKDLPNIVDLFAKTTSTANTNLEGLYEAAKYVAPVATNLGVSMEEVSAAIGLMADSGIKGSMAGTSLRAAMLRLASTPPAAQKAMQALGLSIKDDVTGNLRPLSAITSDISKKFKQLGVSAVDQAAYMSAIFGVEAQTGIQILVNSTDSATKSLGKYTEELKNSSGAAEKAAKARRDNLEGDIKLYQSALSELKLTIYSGIEPILRSFTQSSTGSVVFLTDAFKLLGSAIQTVVPYVITLLTPFNVLIKIVGKLTSFVSTLAYIFIEYLAKGVIDGLYPVVDSFNTLKQAVFDAFEPLINLLTPVIVAVANFIGILLNLNATSKESRSLLVSIASTAYLLGSVIGSVLAISIDGLTKILIVFVELLGKASDGIIYFAKELGIAFQGMANKIQPFIDGFLVAFVPAIAPILDPIKQIFNEITNLISSVGNTDFGQNFVEVFEPILNALSPLVPVFAEVKTNVVALGESFDTLADPIKKTLDDSNALTKAGKYLGESLGFLFEHIVSFVRDSIILTTQSINLLIQTFNLLAKVIGITAGAIVSAFKGEFDFATFSSALKDLFVGAVNDLANVNWAAITKRVLNVVSAYFGYKMLEPALVFIGKYINSSIAAMIAGGSLGFIDDLFLQSVIAVAFKNAALFIGDQLWNLYGLISEFDFKKAGEELINTFVSGITSVANDVYNALFSVFDLVDRLLPHSDADEGPLSDLFASGKALILTIVEGIKSVSVDLYKSLVSVFTVVTNPLQELQNTFYGWMVTFWDGVLENFINIISGKRVSESFGSLIAYSIAAAILSVPYLLTGVASNFITAIVNLITGTFNTIFTLVGDITKGFGELFVPERSFSENVIAFIKAEFMAVVNGVAGIITVFGTFLADIFLNQETLILVGVTGLFQNLIASFSGQFKFFVKALLRQKAIKDLVSALGGMFKLAKTSIFKIFVSLGELLVTLGRNFGKEFPFAQHIYNQINAMLQSYFGRGGRIGMLVRKNFVSPIFDAFYGGLDYLRWLLTNRIPVVDISKVLLTILIPRKLGSRKAYATSVYGQVEAVRRTLQSNMQAIYNVTNGFSKTQPRIWAAILAGFDDFIYGFAKRLPTLAKELAKLGPFIVGGIQAAVEIFTAVWPKNAKQLAFLISRMVISPLEYFFNSLNIALIRLNKASIGQQLINLFRAFYKSIPALGKAFGELAKVFAIVGVSVGSLGAQSVTAFSTFDAFVRRTVGVGIPVLGLLLTLISELAGAFYRVTDAAGATADTALFDRFVVFVDQIKSGMQTIREETDQTAMVVGFIFESMTDPAVVKMILNIASAFLALNPATAMLGLIVFTFSQLIDEVTIFGHTIGGFGKYITAYASEIQFIGTIVADIIKKPSILFKEFTYLFDGVTSSIIEANDVLVSFYKDLESKVSTTYNAIVDPFILGSQAIQLFINDIKGVGNTVQGLGDVGTYVDFSFGSYTEGALKIKSYLQEVVDYWVDFWKNLDDLSKTGLKLIGFAFLGIRLAILFGFAPMTKLQLTLVILEGIIAKLLVLFYKTGGGLGQFADNVKEVKDWVVDSLQSISEAYRNFTSETSTGVTPLENLFSKVFGFFVSLKDSILANTVLVRLFTEAVTTGFLLMLFPAGKLVISILAIAGTFLEVNEIFRNSSENIRKSLFAIVGVLGGIGIGIVGSPLIGFLLTATALVLTFRKELQDWEGTVKSVEDWWNSLGYVMQNVLVGVGVGAINVFLGRFQPLLLLLTTASTLIVKFQYDIESLVKSFISFAEQNKILVVVMGAVASIFLGKWLLAAKLGGAAIAGAGVLLTSFIRVAITTIAQFQSEIKIVVDVVNNFAKTLLDFGPIIGIFVAFFNPLWGLALALPQLIEWINDLFSYFTGSALISGVDDLSDSLATLALTIAGMFAGFKLFNIAKTLTNFASASKKTQDFLNKNPILLTMGVDEKRIKQNISKGAKDASSILKGAMKDACAETSNCGKGIASGTKKAAKEIEAKSSSWFGGLFSTMRNMFSSSVEEGVKGGAEKSRGFLGRLFKGGELFDPSEGVQSYKELSQRVNETHANLRKANAELHKYGKSALEGMTDIANKPLKESKLTRKTPIEMVKAAVSSQKGFGIGKVDSAEFDRAEKAMSSLLKDMVHFDSFTKGSLEKYIPGMTKVVEGVGEVGVTYAQELDRLIKKVSAGAKLTKEDMIFLQKLPTNEYGRTGVGHFAKQASAETQMLVEQMYRDYHGITGSLKEVSDAQLLGIKQHYKNVKIDAQEATARLKAANDAVMNDAELQKQLEKIYARGARMRMDREKTEIYFQKEIQSLIAKRAEQVFSPGMFGGIRTAWSDFKANFWTAKEEKRLASRVAGGFKSGLKTSAKYLDSFTEGLARLTSPTTFVKMYDSISSTVSKAFNKVSGIIKTTFSRNFWSDFFSNSSQAIKDFANNLTASIKDFFAKKDPLQKIKDLGKFKPAEYEVATSKLKQQGYDQIGKEWEKELRFRRFYNSELQKIPSNFNNSVLIGKALTAEIELRQKAAINQNSTARSNEVYLKENQQFVRQSIKNQNEINRIMAKELSSRNSFNAELGRANAALIRNVELIQRTLGTGYSAFKASKQPAVAASVVKDANYNAINKALRARDASSLRALERLMKTAKVQSLPGLNEKTLASLKSGLLSQGDLNKLASSLSKGLAPVLKTDRSSLLKDLQSAIAKIDRRAQLKKSQESLISAGRSPTGSKGGLPRDAGIGSGIGAGISSKSIGGKQKGVVSFGFAGFAADQLVKGATLASTAVTSLNNKTKGLIQTFNILPKGMSAVITGLRGVTVAMKGLQLVGSLAVGILGGIATEMVFMFAFDAVMNNWDSISKYLLQIWNGVENQWDLFVGKMVSSWNSFVEFFNTNPIVQGLVYLVSGLTTFSTITGGVSLALTGLTAVVGGLTTALTFLNVAILSNPITALAVGIATVSFGIIYLSQNFKEFADWINSYWSGLGTVLAAPFEYLNRLGSNIGVIVAGMVDAISSGNWTEAWMTLVDSFSNVASLWWNLVTATFSGIAEAIYTPVAYAIEELFNIELPTFSELIDSISTFFSNALDGAVEFGSNLVGAVIQGIKSTPGKILDALREEIPFYSKAIELTSQGIESGAALVDTVSAGIKGNINTATSAMSELAGSMRDYLPFSPAKEGPLKDLATSGGAFNGELAKGIRSGIPATISAVNDMASKMLASIKANKTALSQELVGKLALKVDTGADIDTQREQAKRLLETIKQASTVEEHFISLQSALQQAATGNVEPLKAIKFGAEGITGSLKDLSDQQLKTLEELARSATATSGDANLLSEAVATIGTTLKFEATPAMQDFSDIAVQGASEAVAAIQGLSSATQDFIDGINKDIDSINSKIANELANDSVLAVRKLKAELTGESGGGWFGGISSFFGGSSVLKNEAGDVDTKRVQQELQQASIAEGRKLIQEQLLEQIKEQVKLQEDLNKGKFVEYQLSQLSTEVGSDVSSELQAELANYKAIVKSNEELKLKVDARNKAEQDAKNATNEHNKLLEEQKKLAEEYQRAMDTAGMTQAQMALYDLQKKFGEEQGHSLWLRQLEGELLKDVGKQITDLANSTDGLSEEQKLLVELEQKYGKEVVDSNKNLVDRLVNLKKQQQAISLIADANKSLAIAGMTEAQKYAYDQKQKGIDPGVVRSSQIINARASVEEEIAKLQREQIVNSIDLTNYQKLVLDYEQRFGEEAAKVNAEKLKQLAYQQQLAAENKVINDMREEYKLLQMSTQERTNYEYLKQQGLLESSKATQQLILANRQYLDDLKEAKEFWLDIKSTISDSFAEFAVGEKTAKESFSAIGDSIEKAFKDKMKAFYKKGIDSFIEGIFGEKQKTAQEMADTQTLHFADSLSIASGAALDLANNLMSGGGKDLTKADVKLDTNKISKDISKAAKDGIEAGSSKGMGPIQSIVKQAMGGIGNLFGKFGAMFSQFLSSDLGKDISDTVGEWGSKLTDYAKDAYDWFSNTDWGKSITDSVTNSDWGKSIMDMFGGGDGGSALFGDMSKMVSDYAGYATAIYDVYSVWSDDMASKEQKWGTTIGAAIGAYFGGATGSALGSKLGGWAGGLISGETRAGGSYQLKADKVEFVKGPSGGEIAGDLVKEAIAETVKSTNVLLQSLGSAAKVVEHYSKLETSTKGKGGVYVGGTLSTGATFGERKWDKNISRDLSPEQAIQEFQTDLQRSVIEALQAAGDTADWVKAIIDDVDTSKLDAEGVKKVLTDIQDFANMLSSLEQMGLVVDNVSKTMLDAAGGIDSFKSGIESYYNTFYSEQERGSLMASNMQGYFTKIFASLDMALPASKEGFRALVESIDTTTEEGQALFGTMIKLGPAFSQYIDAQQKYGTAVLASTDYISQYISALQDIPNQLSADTLKNALSSAIDTTYTNQGTGEEAGARFAMGMMEEMRNSFVNTILQSVSQTMYSAVLQPMITSAMNAATIELQTKASTSSIDMQASVTTANVLTSSADVVADTLVDSSKTMATNMGAGTDSLVSRSQSAIDQMKLFLNNVKDVMSDPEIQKGFQDMLPVMQDLGMATYSAVSSINDSFGSFTAPVSSYIANIDSMRSATDQTNSTLDQTSLVADDAAKALEDLNNSIKDWQKGITDVYLSQNTVTRDLYAQFRSNDFGVKDAAGYLAGLSLDAVKSLAKDAGVEVSKYMDAASAALETLKDNIDSIDIWQKSLKDSASDQDSLTASLYKMMKTSGKSYQDLATSISSLSSSQVLDFADDWGVTVDVLIDSTSEALDKIKEISESLKEWRKTIKDSASDQDTLTDTLYKNMRASGRSYQDLANAMTSLTDSQIISFADDLGVSLDDLMSSSADALNTLKENVTSVKDWQKSLKDSASDQDNLSASLYKMMQNSGKGFSDLSNSISSLSSSQVLNFADDLGVSLDDLLSATSDALDDLKEKAKALTDFKFNLAVRFEGQKTLEDQLSSIVGKTSNAAITFAKSLTPQTLYQLADALGVTEDQVIDGLSNIVDSLDETTKGIDNALKDIANIGVSSDFRDKFSSVIGSDLFGKISGKDFEEARRTISAALTGMAAGDLQTLSRDLGVTYDQLLSETQSYLDALYEQTQKVSDFTDNMGVISSRVSDYGSLMQRATGTYGNIGIAFVKSSTSAEAFARAFSKISYKDMVSLSDTVGVTVDQLIADVSNMVDALKKESEAMRDYQLKLLELGGASSTQVTVADLTSKYGNVVDQLVSLGSEGLIKFAQSASLSDFRAYSDFYAGAFSPEEIMNDVISLAGAMKTQADDAAKDAADASDTAQGAIDDAREAAKAAREELVRMFEVVNDMYKNIVSAATSYSESDLTLADLKTKYGSGIGSIGFDLNLIDGSFAGLGLTIKDLTNISKGAYSSNAALNKIMSETGLTFEDVANDVSSYIQILREQHDAFVDFNTSMTTKALGSLKDFPTEFSDQLVSMKRIMNKYGKDLVSEWVDLGSDGMSAFFAGASQADLQSMADSLGVGFGEFLTDTTSFVDLLSQLTDTEGDRQDQLLDFVKDLGDFVTQLKLDEKLSIYKGTEKLGVAKTDYEKILERAKAGDVKALEDVQNAAKTFLENGRDVWASGSEYTKMFNKVVSDMENLGVSLTGQTPTSDPMIDILGSLDKINLGFGEFAGTNKDILSKMQDLRDLQANSIAAQMDSTNLSAADTAKIAASQATTLAINSQTTSLTASIDRLPTAIAADIKTIFTDSGSTLNADFFDSVKMYMDRIDIGLDKVADAFNTSVEELIRTVVGELLTQFGGLNAASVKAVSDFQDKFGISDTALGAAFGISDQQVKAYKAEGKGDAYSSATIAAGIDAIVKQGGSPEEIAWSIYKTAQQYDVNSAQIANALGTTQDKILTLAKTYGIPAFGEGGNVSGAGFALVGESGPERIQPLKDIQRETEIILSAIADLSYLQSMQLDLWKNYFESKNSSLNYGNEPVNMYEHPELRRRSENSLDSSKSTTKDSDGVSNEELIKRLERIEKAIISLKDSENVNSEELRNSIDTQTNELVRESKRASRAAEDQQKRN